MLDGCLLTVLRNVEGLALGAAGAGLGHGAHLVVALQEFAPLAHVLRVCMVPIELILRHG
eukprot:10637688-Lingulodinium_polyedra.AAC.1